MHAGSGPSRRLLDVAVDDVDEQVAARARRRAPGARRSPPSGGARRCSRCRSSGAPCPPARTAAAGSRAAASGGRRTRRCPSERSTYSRTGVVEAGEVAQLGLVVRVGQEAHVEGRSASRGLPCLKPKVRKVTASLPGRLARRASCRRRPCAGARRTGRWCRSRRRRARAAGRAASRSSRIADRDRAAAGERVAAAGLLVAVDQHVLGRLEVEQPVRDAARARGRRAPSRRPSK